MVKKLLLILLAVLLSAAAITSASADSAAQVIDTEGVLSPEEISRITQEVNEIESAHAVDVIVLITSDTPYDSSYTLYRVADFADDYYDEGGYGMGEDYSGVLYLVDLNNRVQYISTGGIMIDYIDDERETLIFDLCEPYLRREDWGGAALRAVQAIGSCMEEGRQKGVFRYDEATGRRLSGMYNPLEGWEILVALGGGAAAALVMVLIVKGAYDLKGKTSAYELGRKTSCHLTRDEETFIRQSVSRHARSSGSSGGGHSGRSGGRSGGSGVHRSSSGRSHGGGGRRF